MKVWTGTSAVKSIAAKTTGWGASQELVGLKVNTETRDDSDDWRYSFELPLGIGDELRVGTLVRIHVELVEKEDR